MELTVLLLVAASGLVASTAQQATGPPGPDSAKSSANIYTCDKCQWTSELGAYYDLSSICDLSYKVKMQNPRGAELHFGVCSRVPCQTASDTMACIDVPANKPTSTGNNMLFEQIEEFVPSAGVRLKLLQGEMCPVTRKERKTIIDFECQPEVNRHKGEPGPARAWEGEGTDICTYFVHFPSPYGCPTRYNRYSPLNPVITAVSGCIDTVPRRSTMECPPAGGSTITIHGKDFSGDGQGSVQVKVEVNKQQCTDVHVLNPWTLTCVLGPGSGENHHITALFSFKAIDGESDRESFVYSTQTTVSYKPLIDYKRHFDSFMDLGVGGLTKQIQELYQRAFASRSVPASVLKQLGIEHAKGILLHGPPGSGKTLLARTIATILKTQQVKMVNAPEIMSKFLGESEKNLRSHFDEAEKAWAERGESSDLFVIIIDEIDAICKPRGKDDTSAAAAAYDSVVNQLLTKMDGLKSLHNIIVIGLTNRPELIDPALLRPGRFEIQIEIGLPDERGRWEIFYIHTKSMQENQYLAKDVDLEELARNTTQFSGAEIAGVVRLAASYALDRKYGSQKLDVPLLITRSDFQQALKQVKPAYTQTEIQIMKEYLPKGFLSCGLSHANIVSKIRDYVVSLELGDYKRKETVLLHGPRGVGKSGIAAHVASMFKFSYVKVISPHSIVRRTEGAKCDIFIDTFHDAYKADLSLVILDGILQLVELVMVGKEVHLSTAILNTLYTLLQSEPPEGSKVIVIGTVHSEGPNLMDSASGKINLHNMFNVHVYVPKLGAAGALQLLEDVSIRRKERTYFSLPPNFSISLRDMLLVSDCVQYLMNLNKLSVAQTPQAVLDSCLHKYPHIEPVSLNLS